MPATPSRRWRSLERRLGDDGEDGSAVAVGLGAFEHHPGIALTEFEQADVVGEERAVLDVPAGLVTTGAG